jgi:hypothetical protein
MVNNPNHIKKINKHLSPQSFEHKMAKCMHLSNKLSIQSPLQAMWHPPKDPLKWHLNLEFSFIERQCTVFILPLLNLPPTPVVIKFQSQYIVFAKIMKFILSCLSPKYSLVQNVVVKRGYFEYKKTNLTWV